MITLKNVGGFVQDICANTAIAEEVELLIRNDFILLKVHYFAPHSGFEATTCAPGDECFEEVRYIREAFQAFRRGNEVPEDKLYLGWENVRQ